MSAGFTPGPWEAQKYAVHVPGKGPVASVPNPWNDEREREANTRLIAAAPELCEALEAAKFWIGMQDRQSPELGLLIDRALAKARGEA